MRWLFCGLVQAGTCLPCRTYNSSFPDVKTSRCTQIPRLGPRCEGLDPQRGQRWDYHRRSMTCLLYV